MQPRENVIVISLTFTGIKTGAGERPALQCDELSPESVIFGICDILEGVGGGCSHGEDGSDCVQRGNEDPALTDASRQQEGPCGLAVGLSVTEDLPKTAQMCLKTTQKRVQACKMEFIESSHYVFSLRSNIVE